LLLSTVGPLFPPHITDTLLKSSSPNIDNGQIPKCSNPSKYSSWLKEPDVQRRLNLSDQGNQFFFLVLANIVILCKRVFCRNRPHDSNIKMLYVMCSARWKSGTLKWWGGEGSQQKTYMPLGYSQHFQRQHWQISLLIAVENNLFCILLCATVLNKTFLFPTGFLPCKSYFHKI
jgi:hypothetical protein